MFAAMEQPVQGAGLRHLAPRHPRYGTEVKGGFYRIGRGVWHLITPTGEERKGSLLQMAKEGALQAPEGETAEGVPGWQILRPRHLYVRR